MTEADRELERRVGRVPQVVEKQKIIALIIEYLDGQGDPNILHRIEKDDEKDPDENEEEPEE